MDARNPEDPTPNNRNRSVGEKSVDKSQGNFSGSFKYGSNKPHWILTIQPNGLYDITMTLGLAK